MSTAETTPSATITGPEASVHEVLLAEQAEHQARLADMAPDDELVETVTVALDAVAAALVSLEAGTYGSCTDCGATIPVERLEAVPAATICVDCLQRPRALFS